MMNYLLEVSLCWLAFYLLYIIWLSKETFFHINRWYLIVTVLLGLIIPFAEIPISISGTTEELNYLETVTISVQQVEAQIATVVATPVSSGLSIAKILWCIYGIGVFFMTVRFVIGLLQIYKFYKSSIAEKKDDYTLLKNRAVHMPFSFFYFLFISAAAKYTKTELDSITQHELVHIRGRHSVDVLLLELLNIIFWCSPLIYFYRKSVRNVHEYLADEQVLQTTSKKQYGQLLLQQFQKGPGIAMANNFIHSQLKKRILMMTKNQSTNTARWKYLLVLPVFLCLIFVLAKTDLLAQVNNSEVTEEKESAISTLDENDPIYKLVEEMPRFPGCEEKTDKEERKECSQQKMLTFIYSNIRYPKTAQKAGTEGTTVVRFVVAKDGTIQNAEMLRTIGDGCDEEVLRVVGEMPTWIPGKQSGKEVPVYYNLPVKFKLEGEASEEETSSKDKERANVEKLALSDDVFTVVEEMPRFPGCEDITDNIERKNCAQQKMLQFIYKNVKYPKSAQDANTEGVVVVRFVIDQEGEILNSEIVRTQGHGLDEAVLDVVDKMKGMDQKWIPGKQRGQKVKVAYNLPVRFKLDSGESSADKKSKKVEDHSLAVQSFTMSPNPVKDQLRISFEIEDTDGLTLTVTDVNGRMVVNPTQQFSKGFNDITIDLAEAVPGMLFVKLQNGKKVFTKQLVKQ